MARGKRGSGLVRLGRGSVVVISASTRPVRRTRHSDIFSFQNVLDAADRFLPIGQVQSLISLAECIGNLVLAGASKAIVHPGLHLSQEVEELLSLRAA